MTKKEHIASVLAFEKKIGTIGWLYVWLQVGTQG